MCDVAESIIQINCFRKEGIKRYELFDLRNQRKKHILKMKKNNKVTTENNRTNKFIGWLLERSKKYAIKRERELTWDRKSVV